ncbi:hypothetical protein GF382_01695 [Candidatus Falkowbacteria bacterium]|nr:hypothetical protein [Candidatus Falkowbacteria bacterium]
MRLIMAIFCLALFSFTLFGNENNATGEIELAPQGASSKYIPTPDDPDVRRQKNNPSIDINKTLQTAHLSLKLPQTPPGICHQPLPEINQDDQLSWYYSNRMLRIRYGIRLPIVRLV